MEHKLEVLLRFENYRRYYQTCSLWASAFVGRGMEWIYCPESDNGNWIWKGADFYLPDLDMYFVVDLRRPGGGKGRIGCRSMSKKTGKTIVMGDDQGRFKIFKDGFLFQGYEAWLCQCKACGQYFFTDIEGDYSCKICGRHDGKHHLKQIIFGHDSLF